MPKSVIFFLILGGLFALTHVLATIFSLYWYYPWFDIVMHFWGGLLIVLAIYALKRLHFRINTNKRTVFGVALVMIVGWEVFERVIGLFDERVYFFDTTKDMIIGLAGVTIGYILIKRRVKK